VFRGLKPIARDLGGYAPGMLGIAGRAIMGGGALGPVGAAVGTFAVGARVWLEAMQRATELANAAGKFGLSIADYQTVFRATGGAEDAMSGIALAFKRLRDEGPKASDALKSFVGNVRASGAGFQQSAESVLVNAGYGRAWKDAKEATGSVIGEMFSRWATNPMLTPGPSMGIGMMIERTGVPGQIRKGLALEEATRRAEEQNLQYGAGLYESAAALKTLDPKAAYASSLAKIMEMQSVGALGGSEAEMAKQKAQEAFFAASGGPAPLVGAMTEGSVAAYSMQANYGAGASRQEALLAQLVGLVDEAINKYATGVVNRGLLWMDQGAN
jgi:hypothetical protein